MGRAFGATWLYFFLATPLIGSVLVYQCVVNKQLKIIVANKSNEKLANKRLETMKGAKTAMLSDAQLIYFGEFDVLIS